MAVFSTLMLETASTVTSGVPHTSRRDGGAASDRRERWMLPAGPDFLQGTLYSQENPSHKKTQANLSLSVRVKNSLRYPDVLMEISFELVME
ncbi:hypothetical protein P7K49_012876, partial [Saguinus oedipus]